MTEELTEVLQRLGDVAESLHRVGEAMERRERLEGSGGEALERLARANRGKGPRRLTVGLAAGAIPGLAEIFSPVPNEFWALVEQDLGQVSCPCGEGPVIERGQLVSCECQRFYVLANDEMLVANSPQKKIAPVPMEDPEGLEEPCFDSE